MPRYSLPEPNPMGHFFPDDSATYLAIESMREGFLRGDLRNISPDVRRRARAEVQTKNSALDASTYPFAQALNDHIYHGARRRVIMLVYGAFHGAEDVESIVPIDLGLSPYELFQKRSSHTTIDEYVTYEHMGRFIERHRGNLSKKGAREFEVEKSRFFYFSDSDLAEFAGRDLDPYRGGMLLEDLVRLVPLIVPTEVHVVLDEVVGEPNLGDYMSSAPTHVSYRLKQSLAPKLLDKLGTPKGKIKEGGDPEDDSVSDIIVDWVAHRSVVPTIEDVNALEEFLKGNPPIQGSQVEFLYTKDYYEHPKANGFRAKNVVVRVRTSGYEPCIREIQIVDRGQNFVNEIKKGMESHSEHEKKRKIVSKKRRESVTHYGPILDEIFGVGRSVLPI